MNALGGRAMSLLTGIATAVVIVALAILPFLTPQWIGFEQDRSNATGWTGYSADELRAATGSILSDLVVGPPDFDVQVRGQAVLDEREQGHMRDVRTIFLGLWALAALSVVVLLAASRRSDRAATWRAVRRGALGLAIGVVALGAVAVVAFDALFETFHEILFPPVRTPSIRRPSAWSSSSRSSSGRRRRSSWGWSSSPARWCRGRRRTARAPPRPAPEARRHPGRARGPRMTLASPPGLLTVEAAQDAVLAGLEPVGTERVPAADALGRVVAETVIARVSLPPWPNSAMDGYAIRAADTSAATEEAPVRLAVIGDVRAGAAPDVRATGHGGPDRDRCPAARRRRGRPGRSHDPARRRRHPGPRGRDATGPLPSACLVHQAVPIGGSVRAEGSDLQAGATLLEPGVALSAAAVALVAGAGVDEIVVYRRPRIAVLATGDEVRAPGQPLGAAGIPDANGPGLRAQVSAAGAEAIDLGIATDELDDVLARLRRGLDAESTL